MSYKVERKFYPWILTRKISFLHSITLKNSFNHNRKLVTVISKRQDKRATFFSVYLMLTKNLEALLLVTNNRRPQVQPISFQFILSKISFTKASRVSMQGQWFVDFCTRVNCLGLISGLGTNVGLGTPPPLEQITGNEGHVETVTDDVGTGENVKGWETLLGVGNEGKVG